MEQPPCPERAAIAEHRLLVRRIIAFSILPSASVLYAGGYLVWTGMLFGPLGLLLWLSVAYLGVVSMVPGVGLAYLVGPEISWTDRVVCTMFCLVAEALFVLIALGLMVKYVRANTVGG